MPSFNRVLLAGTDYQRTATLEGVFGGNVGTGGGAFNVENGNVWYELQYPIQSSGMAVNRSGYGQADWSSEVLLAPGSGAIPAGVIGIRFRNDSSSFPATVSAAIPEPNTPVLVLSSVGQTAATMIVGRVDAAGAIVSGSGFTVAKGGAGVYTITFTTPFLAPPVFPSPGVVNDVRVADITSLTASQAALTLVTLAGAPTDAEFTFLAQAVT